MLSTLAASRRGNPPPGAFSRMSGLLCYTSRVKSYAEPVQDELVWWAGSAAIAIILSKLQQPPCMIRGLSAPVFEGIDFEEEKSLV
jgi:hypothetical protein